jgi:hypothetical protein
MATAQQTHTAEWQAPPRDSAYWGSGAVRPELAADLQQKAPARSEPAEYTPEQAAFRASLISEAQRQAYDLDLAALSAVKQWGAALTQRVDALERELAAVKHKGLDYQGVWLPDKTYDPNQLVTYDGSMWLALKATSARPGGAGADSRAWKMVVKRGQDGKPGKDLRPGTPAVA